MPRPRQLTLHPRRGPASRSWSEDLVRAAGPGDDPRSAGGLLVEPGAARCSGSCCKTTSTCARCGRSRRCPPHQRAGGRGAGRVERGHERGLATVFGPVTVRRLRLAGGQGAPTSTRPMPRCRCRPGGTATGWPAWRCARRCAAPTTPPRRRSAGGAGRWRASGRSRNWCVRAACDIDAFYARRVPVPCTSEVLLVLSADSKGIVMRPEGLRPATRKAAAGQEAGCVRTRLACGEKPCRKRMATLACVYDAAPARAARTSDRRARRAQRRARSAARPARRSEVADRLGRPRRRRGHRRRLRPGRGPRPRPTRAPGWCWRTGTATRSS